MHYTPGGQSDATVAATDEAAKANALRGLAEQRAMYAQAVASPVTPKDRSEDPARPPHSVMQWLNSPFWTRDKVRRISALVAIAPSPHKRHVLGTSQRRARAKERTAMARRNLRRHLRANLPRRSSKFPLLLRREIHCLRPQHLPQMPPSFT